MTGAIVDTTVLYAAGNRNTHRHEQALELVHGADDGSLPALHIPDPVAVETMNGLTRDVSHATAVDMLARLRAGTQFEISREPMTVWASGLDLFERIERLSLADALIVASVRHHDLQYLYSFDADFDGLDGVTRLATPDDPYAP